MAMTKAEQAQMEALKVRLALAWPPEPPKPIDIAVAQEASDKPWFRAWWLNTYARRVGPGVVVNDGLHSTSDYTDAQLETRYDGRSRVSFSKTNGGPWFATERDALMALHYAVAMECAGHLYQISKRIEAA